MTNFGTKIKIKFDDFIHNVSDAEGPQFRLVDADGNTYYGTTCRYGDNFNEVVITFPDFNDIVPDVLFECLQCIHMGSEYVSLGAFSQRIFLQNLWPKAHDYEYLEISSVSIIGTITDTTPKMITIPPDGYIQVSSASIVGQLTAITYTSSAQQKDGYIQITAVSIAGQLCDTNGIPL